MEQVRGITIVDEEDEEDWAVGQVDALHPWNGQHKSVPQNGQDQSSAVMHNPMAIAREDSREGRHRGLKQSRPLGEEYDEGSKPGVAVSWSREASSHKPSVNGTWRAAQIIQAAARGFLVRSEILRIDEELSAAASRDGLSWAQAAATIQAAARGFLVRNEIIRMDMELAAAQIQSTFRSFLVRRARSR